MWMCGRTCAQRVEATELLQGLVGWGYSSKGRTGVIRIGPLLFGFTSNKDNSGETEAPHFPSLKTKARPKIGESGSI